MSGGIKRYTARLFEELLKIKPEVFYPFGNDKESFLFKNKLNYWVEVPKSNKDFINRYSAFNYLINDLDFVFSTYFPVSNMKEVKTILTIHDLIPIIYPEYAINQSMDSFFRKEIFEAANSASLIIADSYSTKNDILNMFNIPESKVEVVYLGCDIANNLKPNRNDLAKFKVLENQYILSVCTLEPRKNLDGVIQAFEKLKVDNPNLKLVLTGSYGWNFEAIIAKKQSSPYKEDIILTDYVEDAQLVSLYNFALAFVYPSFYEGFGLPILEAMAHGTPVITSITSSMPEVGGDACLYCDPEDITDLAKKINEVITNPNLAEKMIEKGRERAKEFTWEKTAEKTFDLIMNLNK